MSIPGIFAGANRSGSVGASPGSASLSRLLTGPQASHFDWTIPRNPAWQKRGEFPQLGLPLAVSPRGTGYEDNLATLARPEMSINTWSGPDHSSYHPGIIFEGHPRSHHSRVSKVTSLFCSKNPLEGRTRQHLSSAWIINMGLGILKDHKLVHVPGTVLLSDESAQLEAVT
ncbi:hypothetical protein FOPE_01678 [Fonsecaea pedrosoi]|nr:hypothetical protein FOPE_01678 [Fonsecaea pedrosoi]